MLPKRIYFENVRARFNSLKMWRKAAAAKRNMLPEAILGNEALERIAFSAPRTMAEFQRIRGISAEKAQLYADDILKYLKQ